jgi:hypothetical protein
VLDRTGPQRAERVARPRRLRPPRTSPRARQPRVRGHGERRQALRNAV